MKHYPVPHVTMTIHHGNIGLYGPHDGGFRLPDEPGLPWAVLATLHVKFHFDMQRERYKILKARVRLGEKEPVGYQLTDAYGMARSMLVRELNCHGVFSVFEDDLDLHDSGTVRFDHPDSGILPEDIF